MAKLKLAKYLEEQGLSKNAFARLLDVNPPVVRRFIKPDYDPKLSTLSKWAKKLKCEVSDLLEEEVHKASKSKRKP
jgi:predicted transcriptional regulator